MDMNSTSELRRLTDRAEIYDVICKYARAVDRANWELLRSTYHPDAQDDHVEYKGHVDGLIQWLTERFAGVDNSMHFLGNCFIEFVTPDLAFVETYYESRRLRPPSADERKTLARGDAVCRQSCGRYLDRFERRRDEWRIAERRVVVETRFTSVAMGGERNDLITWGTRDRSDPLWSMRAEYFGPEGGMR